MAGFNTDWSSIELPTKYFTDQQVFHVEMLMWSFHPLCIVLGHYTRLQHGSIISNCKHDVVRVGWQSEWICKDVYM